MTTSTSRSNNGLRTNSLPSKPLPVKKDRNNIIWDRTALGRRSLYRQPHNTNNKAPRRFSVIAPSHRHALSFSMESMAADLISCCSSSSSCSHKHQYHRHHHQIPQHVSVVQRFSSSSAQVKPRRRCRVVDQWLTRLMSELGLPSQRDNNSPNSGGHCSYCNTTTAVTDYLRTADPTTASAEDPVPTTAATTHLLRPRLATTTTTSAVL